MIDKRLAQTFNRETRRYLDVDYDIAFSALDNNHKVNIRFRGGLEDAFAIVGPIANPNNLELMDSFIKLIIKNKKGAENVSS